MNPPETLRLRIKDAPVEETIMLRLIIPVIFLCLTFFSAIVPAQENKPVYVGFDGEFGLLNSTSAQSIERGIRIALDEINEAGGVLHGRPMKLLTRDNRSIPARGRENIRRFAEVEDLVAVVGGRYSPVLLDEIDLIHELGIVLLDAWGSADGITEHEYLPSYTFRLSLRDRYAMPTLLRHALEKGAKRVGIMLPNTGWGRSNAKAAQRYQEHESAPKILKSIWYHWGEKEMLRHYRILLSAGVDAVILVANDIEGSRLVHQLAAVDDDERLPIISHWGVTGGKMVEKSGETLHKLDFSVVQTFSLFTADPQIRDRVMSRAKRLFDIQRIEDVESPVGFGHAYDLMQILARAVNIAGTTNRARVRDALEQVRDYQGLTGSYARPFTPESHDALKQEQVFMARYREDGVIVPLSLGRK